LSGVLAGRRVAATFARRPIAEDPQHERDLAGHLRETMSVEERQAFYDRFRQGTTKVDGMMRRIVLRSLVAEMGHDVTIAPGVTLLHPDRFWIADGVFLAANVYLQGRHDGTCRIGKRVWVGPGAYLDARDLEIGDYVGWGPGAKVLGSAHTAEPVDQPVVMTDLIISPVRICSGADVGVDAVILPGVTVGEGAIVGAGAVVSRDVEPYTVVAGVPARKLRDRVPGNGPHDPDQADAPRPRKAAL
jgi:acetyltransferase-like isoleucine patch superfamily enzyme